MNYDHRAVLLLLWFLPLIAGLLVYSQRKRAAAARRFIETSMLNRLMPPLIKARSWIKWIFALLGLAAIIVAGARPRFGAYFEKVVQRGVDCFICLDVSRSMLAEDVAPNRLERAKSDILDLLRKLAGDHVGLIVFAGKPVVEVPLTTDEGFLRTALEEVNTRSTPRGGTHVGDALRKAMEAMPPRVDHDQIIVLITDGEDQDSFPAEAAKQAAERGIKIFTVGLGDATEGARIPIRDKSGSLTYLKDENKEHWSKTDHDLLRQIALTTGGAHIPAGTKTYDLGQIYEDHLANLARGEEEKIKQKRYRDRYQIFLGIGIALLVLQRMVPIYARPNGRRSER